MLTHGASISPTLFQVTMVTGGLQPPPLSDALPLAFVPARRAFSSPSLRQTRRWGRINKTYLTLRNNNRGSPVCFGTANINAPRPQRSRRRANSAAGIKSPLIKHNKLLEDGGKVYRVKFDVNFTNKASFMDDYAPPPPPTGPADASSSCSACWSFTSVGRVLMD